jgi:hypothetical protein
MGLHTTKRALSQCRICPRFNLSGMSPVYTRGVPTPLPLQNPPLEGPDLR